METRKDPLKLTWILPVLFILIAIILLFTGWFQYKNEKERVKTEQIKMLSSITSFKVKEIGKWFHERRADGVFVSTTPLCLSLIERLLRDPGDVLSGRELTKMLTSIKTSHEYTAISISDMDGRKVYDFGGRDSSVSQKEGRKNSGFSVPAGITFSELREDSTGKSYLDMIVPVSSKNRPIAFLSFRIDPSVFLYPLISSWPFEQVTTSSSLARMEDDQLHYLYLSDVPDRDLDKLVSDSKMDDLSGKILAANNPGFLEVKDHRGIDVFAYYGNIPGTSWFLISKIDQQEVFAPLRALVIKVLLFLFAFMIVILIIAIMIWKNHQLQYSRSQLELKSVKAGAEEKVRFMNALLQEVNDAVITFDKDLMILSWNKGAERIYGWKKEEVVGKFGGGALQVAFHGASKEQVFNELEQKGSWKGELIHKRKDGNTAYILSSASQLLDENGKILGIIAINKDVSELVHSEKIRDAIYRISELAHSSKDLDEMYASFHVVIGELLDAQNLFIALVENKGEVITYPYFADEKESAPQPHRAGNGLTEFVLRTGKPLLAKPEDIKYFIDRNIIEPPGSGLVDWIGAPLRIENETIGVLAIRSYSLKTRYGEWEKSVLNFVSEQIALSIHRKKIQQDLIEAMQKAEVSSKLTSSLLANMNHELRTPMNGILGFAEILMNELEDPDRKTKAENILISGRRLMDTLDAIMDLSYLESDKITRKFKPIKVDKIVRSVLMTYEPIIKRKNLGLNSMIPPGLTVMGDEHLLQHMVKNIVDNAVKYTDQGSISIKATLSDKGGTPMVSIAIRDTGIGISKENQEMIFETFRQVSEGYGRKFEGSGLGLSISKKIATLLNGEIRVKSRPGEGSEFTILLPAVIEVPEWKPVDVGELLKPKIHKGSGKKVPDILLVEDNTINLQLLMFYLKDLGNIYSALDGKTAIEITQNQKFDVILMDINLGPGMDGIQAMLEIRKRSEYQSVTIIAVTGYASIGDRERLIITGFTDYLPKPFEKDKVIELFSTILSIPNGK